MSHASFPELPTKVSALLIVATGLAFPMRIIGVAGEQLMLGGALLAGFYLIYLSAEVRGLIRSGLTSVQGKLLISMFAAWTFVSAFSVSPADSLEIVMRTGLFMVGALVIASVVKVQQSQHDLFWKTMIGAAIFTGMLAVLALFGVDFILPVIRARLGEEIQADTALKAFTTASVVMLPVIFYGGRQLGGRWHNVGYVFSALVFLMVFITNTRSAMAGLLGMAVTFLVLFAWSRRKYMKTIVVTVLSSTTALMLWVRNDRMVYESVFGDQLYLPGWLIDPHRQYIWKFAFERFLDHPWVGNGIDQLNKLPGAHVAIARLGSEAHMVPSHPHNWIIEILSESGIIGLAPVLIVLAYILVKLVKRVLRERDETAYIQTLLLVGFMTCAMFSFSIWAAWWLLELFVLFAVLWAIPANTLSKA